MFKDILIRYDLPPETDYVPPKRILQYCVEEYISRGVKKDHTDLKKFLDNVIPFEGKRHFIYVQDEEGTTYNFHLDRYDCIKALLALCEHKLTVYFHPTAFKKWMKDKFAISYRCIYVDIDDVSFPFSLEDATEEITSFSFDINSMTDCKRKKFFFYKDFLRCHTLRNYFA